MLFRSFPKYVSYGGKVPFDKSVDILKNYFALLFPTYYDGEGFAGTLIDAFSAGVPVIASDWKYNAEIVNEKVGIVYSAKDRKAVLQLSNIWTIFIKKMIQCVLLMCGFAAAAVVFVGSVVKSATFPYYLQNIYIHMTHM